jgi:hypothetical protein
VALEVSVVIISSSDHREEMFMVNTSKPKSDIEIQPPYEPAE